MQIGVYMHAYSPMFSILLNEDGINANCQYASQRLQDQINYGDQSIYIYIYT